EQRHKDQVGSDHLGEGQGCGAPGGVRLQNIARTPASKQQGRVARNNHGKTKTPATRGQGGGFYDRTLDGLRRHPSPPGFIGLAFAGQEIAAVPMASHDQRLDGVLTESGYRAFP
ncbi:MAG: 5-formyltetrahydrofolate cyclo-ligase, partial [Brevundimonas sp.]